MDGNFAQVGAIIYGAQRLDFVVGGLSAWMAGVADGVERLDAAPSDKLTARLAVAETYFDRMPHRAELADDYRKLLSTVCWLVEHCQRIENADADALVELGEVTRVAHGQAADVIEGLGYAGVQAGPLRAKQHE